MPKETERKFLVKSDEWRNSISETIPIRQAYIYTGPPIAIRIRITPEKATLNLKKATLETTKDEFEYEIPTTHAEELLQKFTSGYTIEKNRHIVFYQGIKWEIDEFLGANEGLILAEVELPTDTAELPIPPWLGKEVSSDFRYLNTYLSQHPFKTWNTAK